MMLSRELILKATDGEIISDRENPEVSSVSIDSRRIKKNQLFIAIKGDNFDGHDFLDEAFERGATSAIVEKIPENKKIYEGKLLIRVSSTEKALADLAKEIRHSNKNLKLAAITGSNGKTTTKEMTYSILSVNHNVLKNTGNFNNNIGLPLTLLNLEKNHEMCVVELGMNDFGEIRYLTDIADPDIGAITSIGRAHLEKLGSIEGVAKAKGELVEKFGSDNIFCVNIDDPRILSISRNIDCKKIHFSLDSKQAEIHASDIKRNGFESMNFKIHVNDQTASLRLRGIGKHNILNSLCASSIAHAMGCSIEEIQAGLERYIPTQMRLEVLETPQGFTVLNDSYNANPDSMIKGIEELVTYRNKNKVIAVLGDMLELGAKSIEEHRKLGQYLSKSKVDVVLALGKESQYIIEGLNGSSKGFYLENHEEAAKLLKELAVPGDVVLVKGSRGMKMEKVIQNFYKD